MANKPKKDPYADKPFSVYGAADKIKKRKQRQQDEMEKIFGKHHSPGSTGKIRRGE